ncbi:MAG: ACP phosphodiesterase [Flavobacteriales bacterium]
MNFLAHIFLSGQERAVQAGNLFGDEIKGRDYSYLPHRVAAGVSLHRHIDSFTDEHEMNLKTKGSLHEDFGKYAGVALDIYYDHFLSRHWATYTAADLKEFAAGVYSELDPFVELFSARSRKLFDSMKTYGWLSGYGEMDGMVKTFNGMSRLLPEESGMKDAVGVLEKKYDMIELAFIEYFPDLLNTTRLKLVDLSV